MHSKPWDRYTVSWRDCAAMSKFGLSKKTTSSGSRCNRPPTNRSRLKTVWLHDPSWYLSRGDLFWSIHIQQHSVTTSQESWRLPRCLEGWTDDEPRNRRIACTALRLDRPLGITQKPRLARFRKSIILQRSSKTRPRKEVMPKSLQ